MTPARHNPPRLLATAAWLLAFIWLSLLGPGTGLAQAQGGFSAMRGHCHAAMASDDQPADKVPNKAKYCRCCAAAHAATAVLAGSPARAEPALRNDLRFASPERSQTHEVANDSSRHASARAPPTAI